MHSPWQRGHLLVDDTDSLCCIERNQLLLMAHDMRGRQPDAADLILDDVQCVDAVDTIILKMMGRA